MKAWFLSQPVLIQTLIGGTFTWLMTTLGAALIFFVANVPRKIFDAMLGFAAGIMLASTFWSLLDPAINLSEKAGHIPWLAPSIGFLAGSIFLWILDKIIPHLHIDFPEDQAEGIKTHWNKNVLLVLAITLHNIPEGLAVGVAFGSAAVLHNDAAVLAAVSLAIGIGIQDFPEGLAVSAPLKHNGWSTFKSFIFGQFSGLVELIAAFVGVLIVQQIQNLLPYALAFAAGAMTYVVVEELIPESQLDNQTHISTFGLIFGFIIMMILDIALG